MKGSLQRSAPGFCSTLLEERARNRAIVEALYGTGARVNNATMKAWAFRDAADAADALLAL
jgi:hypothetical protein